VDGLLAASMDAYRINRIHADRMFLPTSTGQSRLNAQNRDRGHPKPAFHKYIEYFASALELLDNSAASKPVEGIWRTAHTNCFWFSAPSVAAGMRWKNYCWERQMFLLPYIRRMVGAQGAEDVLQMSFCRFAGT